MWHCPMGSYAQLCAGWGDPVTNGQHNSCNNGADGGTTRRERSYNGRSLSLLAVEPRAVGGPSGRPPFAVVETFHRCPTFSFIDQCPGMS